MDAKKQWGDKPKERWHVKGTGTVNTDDLRTWLQEMSKWAKRVQDDILRMEEHLKLAAGDPGPPPPPPE